ncbi:hypothetical protein L7F22_048580 [Adiantum nelumboides]|nr:hypothetical protein [Adiantum nelumboides]
MLAAVVLLLVTGGVAAAGPAATPEQRAATAVEVALRQIGLPFVWGGNGPENGDRGFDCSGLTAFAYGKAGVVLPRTAHAQYRRGPRVPAGSPLRARPPGTGGAVTTTSARRDRRRPPTASRTRRSGRRRTRRSRTSPGSTPPPHRRCPRHRRPRGRPRRPADSAGGTGGVDRRRGPAAPAPARSGRVGHRGVDRDHGETEGGHQPQCPGRRRRRVQYHHDRGPVGTGTVGGRAQDRDPAQPEETDGVEVEYDPATRREVDGGEHPHLDRGSGGEVEVAGHADDDGRGGTAPDLDLRVGGSGVGLGDEEETTGWRGRGHGSARREVGPVPAAGRSARGAVGARSCTGRLNGDGSEEAPPEDAVRSAPPAGRRPAGILTTMPTAPEIPRAAGARRPAGPGDRARRRPPLASRPARGAGGRRGRRRGRRRGALGGAAPRRPGRDRMGGTAAVGGAVRRAVAHPGAGQPARRARRGAVRVRRGAARHAGREVRRRGGRVRPGAAAGPGHGAAAGGPLGPGCGADGGGRRRGAPSRPPGRGGGPARAGPAVLGAEPAVGADRGPVPALPPRHRPGGHPGHDGAGRGRRVRHRPRVAAVPGVGGRARAGPDRRGDGAVVTDVELQHGRVPPGQAAERDQVVELGARRRRRERPPVDEPPATGHRRGERAGQVQVPGDDHRPGQPCRPAPQRPELADRRRRGERQMGRHHRERPQLRGDGDARLVGEPGEPGPPAGGGHRHRQPGPAGPEPQHVPAAHREPGEQRDAVARPGRGVTGTAQDRGVERGPRRQRVRTRLAVHGRGAAPVHGTEPGREQRRLVVARRSGLAGVDLLHRDDVGADPGDGRPERGAGQVPPVRPTSGGEVQRRDPHGRGQRVAAWRPRAPRSAGTPASSPRCGIPSTGSAAAPSSASTSFAASTPDIDERSISPAR